MSRGGPGWPGYAAMDGRVQRFAPFMVEAGLATAAELLFRRLDGEEMDAVQRVIPVKLVARGSGEISPVAAPAS